MLRLCLDLNIWIAALLADRKGRNNTASQYLIEVIRSGNDTYGEASLIISLGMLDELQSVIVAHNVQIVHLYLMVEWLRSGNIPKISNTNRD